jgi:hypothetical protein
MRRGSYGAGLYGAGPYGGATYLWPSPKVEIDVTNKPTNPTRAWTDVTPLARSMSWSRAGRLSELDRTAPGMLTSLILDNRPGPVTGRPFDRDNSSSPYAAGLGWSYWIRLSAVWGATTYPLWTGLKDSVPKQRPQLGSDHIATVTGTDAMKVLAQFPLTGLTYPGQAFGDRVSAVLADAGAEAGTIDSGDIALALPAVTFADDDTTSALQHLQDVERDEGGAIFARADGKIDAQSFYHRSDAYTDGPAGTIGDDSSADVLYRGDGDLADDNSYLWNIVAVTPAGGSPQVWLDDDSIDDDYQRRLDLAQLSTDAGDALASAQYYVYRYSNPAQRPSQFEVLGAATPGSWPLILAAANGDLFEWADAPSGASEVYLEQVSGSWDVGEPPRLFWDASAAARDAFWLADIDGRTEADLTTIAAR